MAGTQKNVAVIGAGCTGLACAWHLNRSGVNVSLFESDSRIGGHANTVHVEGVDVDTGFMVYNKLNYPYLIALFDELQVEGEETNMGFSVSMDNGSFEWCGDSIRGLLANISNLFNPDFYCMFYDILRFNKMAQTLLKLPPEHPDRNISVGEYLSKYKYSDAFAKYYLVPMTAAIWSASTEGIMSFPAITLLTFLNNHLLLQVSGHMVWRTPKQRSKQYVEAIQKELGDKIHTDFKIKRYSRDEKGHHITDASTDISHTFDAVVFACHPDQTLAILGECASTDEVRMLSKFHYSANDTYVHCDEALMPKSKAAWASWNYLGESNNFKTSTNKPVFVTYWLNRLQNLTVSTPIFVSLNPSQTPAVNKTFQRISYSHPQYTAESVNAQNEVLKNQGALKTWFAGAWLGYGFHEDGVRTGLNAAVQITKNPLPWTKSAITRKDNNSPVTGPLASVNQPKTWFNGTFGFVVRPLVDGLVVFCQYQVQAFLRQGFRKGQITIITTNGETVTYGDASSSNESVTVRVNNPWFWVRVALEFDLGLGKSYMAGEWELVDPGDNFDGLTKMLMMFVDNMSSSTVAKKTGLNVSNMATAWIGGLINYVWYALTMDNTVANSRSNIHAHYDLSNGLFETFLDKQHMMYSCALFDTKPCKTDFERLAVTGLNGHANGNGHTNGYTNGYTNGHSAQTNGHAQECPVSVSSLTFTDTLETAQRRKIDALLNRLGPVTTEDTLLDIGFGWGGICIRAAERFGCKVHGITLSTEQKAMAEQRVLAKGLDHLITFELVDYRLFAARGLKFTRIVSCEMIEAVGHNHLGEFFAAVENMLATNGTFVMQAITTPESRYTVNVNSADFINTVIFPGGCCPSLTALLNAMSTHSSLHLEGLVNVSLHYAQTLREWRRRFNAALPRIYELGFDDAFIRCWNLYLSYCEAGFEARIMNLNFLTFSRPGNSNVITLQSTFAVEKYL